MVHQPYFDEFVTQLHNELHPKLAADPQVYLGGTQQDHYKGLSSSVATRVVPFYKESYTPTEFLYGFAPLNLPGVPCVYFQTPVLDVKGKNIPGALQTAAYVPAPIPGSIITPMIGLTNRYIPMSAVGT